MENVGCVTFNEAYLFRSTPTLARRAKRADTFLHEMVYIQMGLVQRLTVLFRPFYMIAYLINMY